jgi:hypothetical protein
MQKDQISVIYCFDGRIAKNKESRVEREGGSSVSWLYLPQKTQHSIKNARFLIPVSALSFACDIYILSIMMYLWKSSTHRDMISQS